MGLGHILSAARQGLRLLADYAIPPRCPGCGTIVRDDHQFCLQCWRQIDFLDGPACAGCSVPLALADDDDQLCGACLADPPPFTGAPSAVAYGAIMRTVALRLKYGRRIGHAQLMAGLMARHIPRLDPPAILVPVPLHRWRIWSRGFNQSALIAGHLAKMTGADLTDDTLLRVKATPSMRGLGRKGRAKAVRGAFALAPRSDDRLAGRHLVIIDDVHASGATLRACAKALQKSGAARVSALTWARVIPEAMMRERAAIDFAPYAADI